MQVRKNCWNTKTINVRLWLIFPRIQMKTTHSHLSATRGGRKGGALSVRKVITITRHVTEGRCVESVGMQLVAAREGGRAPTRSMRPCLITPLDSKPEYLADCEIILPWARRQRFSPPPPNHPCWIHVPYIISSWWPLVSPLVLKRQLQSYCRS